MCARSNYYCVASILQSLYGQIDDTSSSVMRPVLIMSNGYHKLEETNNQYILIIAILPLLDHCWNHPCAKYKP